MVEHRWIKLFLILMVELQFTGASFFIRLGGEVSFPCNYVIPDQNKCENTTWIFSGSGNTAAVELIILGKIKEHVKSDRLSVTENCSLVIKNVTVDDAGRYTCRQFDKSGRQQGPDSQFDLSVVTLTQHTDTDKVTLICSVWTHEQCRLTVKWLYEGKDVENNPPNVKTSQSPCNTTVTVLSSHHMYSSWYTSLKCEVRDGDSEQLFTFNLQPPGDDTVTATTDQWWWFIIVVLVLVALLILAVIRWKRTKGNKSQINNKLELTSEPAVTKPGPETSPNMTDPEDGVSYSSIRFKTNSEDQACTKNKDDDSVTYTTVKASAADPSNLYATITK